LTVDPIEFASNTHSGERGVHDQRQVFAREVADHPADGKKPGT
jgi:hypothetical protein